MCAPRTMLCGEGSLDVPQGGCEGQFEGAWTCQGPPDVSPPCLPVFSQLQAQKLRLAHSRGPFYSGSLPNVNQIGTGVPEFQVTPQGSAPWRCLGRGWTGTR